MQLKNELCEICIAVDDSYNMDSKDNNYYDIIYNPDNNREFYKAFSMWKFSGRDIFVSVSGKNPFELCKDRIKLYDFNDNYYEIDFSGNELI